MKYLRKFNEELSPNVYSRAAKKLQKISKENPRLGKSLNAEERALKLNLHATDMEMRESLERWEKNVKENSKFGTFKLEIFYKEKDEDSIKSEFYLKVNPEFMDLQESWNEYKEFGETENRDMSICFSVGLIPTNKNDIDNIMEKFEGDLDFYNGYFWGFWIYIDYKVVDGVSNFSKLQLIQYDSSVSELLVPDNKTRQQLKKLVMSIFDENSDLNKLSSNTSNLYEVFDKEVIQDLDLYTEYGIDQERIINDLRKVPASSFSITD
jgi:hypothetical protein